MAIIKDLFSKLKHHSEKGSGAIYPNFSNIMRNMNVGDSYESIKSPVKRKFEEYCKSYDITVDDAKTLYDYSVCSNLMMARRRGKSMSELTDSIFNTYRQELTERGCKESKIDHDITAMKEYIKNVPLDKSFHEATENLSKFTGKNKIDYASAHTLIYDLNNLAHADELGRKLDKVLPKTALKEDKTVYRAVNPDYIYAMGITDLSQLKGKTLINNDPTSTAKSYGKSFHDHEGCDLIFEMKIPKGTPGIDMECVSSYGKVESELLLAPNAMTIDAIEERLDKHGNKKTIATCSVMGLDKYKTLDRVKRAQFDIVEPQSDAQISL